MFCLLIGFLTYPKHLFSGDNSSLVAAAATMGGLNIILLAALVFLFLRHKNILPAIKSGTPLRFQYYLGYHL